MTKNEKMLHLYDLWEEFRDFNNLTDADFLPFKGPWGSIKVRTIEGILDRYKNRKFDGPPLSEKIKSENIEMMHTANEVYRILMQAKKGNYGT